MNKIISILFLSSFLFANNYEYENKHLEKFIDIDENKVNNNQFNHKFNDDSNLRNFVNLETVSNNIWIDTVFSDITLERYNKQSKQYKDLFDYKSFHSLEVEKLRNEFYLNNSKGLNKIQSIYLYLKIFDLGTIDDVKKTINDRLEPYQLYKVFNTINSLNNNTDFINKELNSNNKLESFFNIINEYESFNYAGKIKANIALRKILSSLEFNNDIKENLEKIKPIYDIQNLELIGSYYSIISKINDKDYKKNLLNEILSFNDNIIKLIALYNSKLDNNQVLKIKSQINLNSIDSKVFDYKYLIDKKIIENFINNIE